jgi:hypothetical protein
MKNRYLKQSKMNKFSLTEEQQKSCLGAKESWLNELFINSINIQINFS